MNTFNSGYEGLLTNNLKLYIMEIQSELVPILGFIIFFILSWLIAGCPINSDEIFISNPLSMLLSIISFIFGLISIIIYPCLLINWLYNNITII